MSKKNNSGCRIAALIFCGILLVFGLGVAGIIWMFTARKAGEKEARNQETAALVESAQAPDEEVRLDFDASDLESLEPLEEGQPVTLRHYILMTTDPRATDLAKEAFRQRADGAPATWRLTLQSIGQGDGFIVADLLARYAFHIRGGMSGSTMMVRAKFDDSQRESLIGLRQEDRVTVSGTLDLSGDEVLITDAQVVTPE